MIIIHISQVLDEVWLNAYAKVREDDAGNPIDEVTVPLGNMCLPIRDAVGPESLATAVKWTLRRRGEAISQLPWGWHSLL